MFNLSTILEDNLRNCPDKDAFIFNDVRFSYRQINEAANRAANMLVAKGIQPGDKIALSCLNLPHFPILYYGILKTGAVVVPVNVLLKANEIGYVLNNSDAKVFLCFEGTPELPMAQEGYAGFQQAVNCEEFIPIMTKNEAPSPFPDTVTYGQLLNQQPVEFNTVQTNGHDTAVIIYTSGTTGQPKGAELSHDNLFLNANVTRRLLESTQQDTQIITLPLFHIFAMTCQLNTGVYSGETSILIPRFDPETVLGAMLKYRATIFCAVPTMYWGLLNYENENLDYNGIKENLRICLSGGASLPVQVLEDFEKKYEVPILEGYGMSEGSPVVTFNHLHKKRKPGSIGTPVWGVDVMVADQNNKPLPPGEKGQILYRGHNVMKGYYKDPHATEQAIKGGWMHSGDVGVMDEDGYFYIVDRTKDMIIRGGFNVYPREVEEVMIRHEDISLVAVIGVPDEQHGEEIKACVVLERGKQISKEEIIHWSKEHLATYKYPRIVEFMDTLPINATGKIMKNELRKMHATVDQ
ncbi:long-chain fatty acid--CoA ligase [Fulvivirgaceae bacterium BMA12]|uniref:Long-chain fatty acid--CoA ligase n=1 Tax=Agaribacillus aureus TaxID=3051825 RepID=A0ABT8LJ45_9BACT|nr:long-chain fatty acid--CoA ligase [Fulvivirgaceae bacterium BMA12]